MISDQFKKDYRQMTAQGVTFTPEDIVRLNALSVKTRLSSTAARDVHLPRLAFMPADSWWRAPLVFREPTIAHDLWIEMARRWIDTSNGVRFYFLNAFALSRHPGKLPDADNPKKVIKAVYTFAAKRLCRFTHAQLIAAIDYALFGADWTVGERGPESAKDEGRSANGESAKDEGRSANGESAKDEGRSANNGIDNSTVGPSHLALRTLSDPPSPTIGLLTECRMLRLPISLDDAKRMTASELTEAINRCWDLDGKFNPERSHQKAFGEYVRAREEIRRRSKKNGEAVSRPLEKDATPSNGQNPPNDGGNHQ